MMRKKRSNCDCHPYACEDSEGNCNCWLNHNNACFMSIDAGDEKGNKDMVTAFTTAALYGYEPGIGSESYYGYGNAYHDAAIIRADTNIVMVDESVMMAHEVAHVYGATHCNNSCIMRYYTQNGKIYFRSVTSWCSSCASSINSNRTSYSSTTL